MTKPTIVASPSWTAHIRGHARASAIASRERLLDARTKRSCPGPRRARAPRRDPPRSRCRGARPWPSAGHRARRTSSRNASERGLPLEDVADELAHRGLDLALDARRRGAARRSPRCPGAGTPSAASAPRATAASGRAAARAAVAEHAAERRHPAEALVGLEHPVALDAAVHLGPDCPARRRGASRTSAPRAPAPCRRRAARRRAAAARTAARPAWRSSSERSASSARYHAVAALSSESRRCSQACPTLTWVTTSNVRPRASATLSSANGSRLPPRRDVGRRTPLAIALSLPSAGVISVRTRSASPRSNRDRTMASVV